MSEPIRHEPQQCPHCQGRDTTTLNMQCTSDGVSYFYHWCKTCSPDTIQTMFTTAEIWPTEIYEAIQKKRRKRKKKRKERREPEVSPGDSQRSGNTGRVDHGISHAGPIPSPKTRPNHDRPPGYRPRRWF